MAKRYYTTNSLVIVESPAKCKKIEGYLGPGYKCLASFGHLRELPDLKHIDKNFAPSFTIIDNDLKRKQIEVLRKAIALTDEVILATDDDREGEAIAWHICKLFDLSVEKTKRIVFHEITESAIQQAIKNPRTINMNIVYAQQSRQILDLLVGFKISPTLWKHIARNKENSLSAGRCQTPAVKLVYENQKEIDKNPGELIYQITGYFTKKCVPFEFQTKYKAGQEVVDFLDKSSEFKHEMCIPASTTRTYKAPPQPFTTSALQQKASNEFRFSPKDTMKMCQTLYEAGYITYMRTDSKTYSKEFLEGCKTYITGQFGQEYVSSGLDGIVSSTKGQPKKDSNKPGLAQEAHEAIRPTLLSLKEVTEKVTAKEAKLYTLIWKNTVASCMSPAVYDSLSVTINSPVEGSYVYRCESNAFPGWQQVYGTIKKDTAYAYMTSLLGLKLPATFSKLTASVTIRHTKSHYTEASLVQKLEELGIGRPSTFSMIIDKIQQRGYVKKMDLEGKEFVCNDYELENGEISEIEKKKIFGNEKGKLVVQPVGLVTMEFLEKNFGPVFQYDYTKQMEDDLDEVASGEKEFKDLCSCCDKQLADLLSKLNGADKTEYKIDDQNSYIIGKHGPVIKCVTTNQSSNKEMVEFKPVKSELDYSKIKNGEYRLEEMVAPTKPQDIPLGIYQNEPLYVKMGKFGLYATWGKNNKSLGKTCKEALTYEEVVELLDENENKFSRELYKTPKIEISIRNGKHGDYVFYKTPKAKKPQFLSLSEFKEDYKTCNTQIILDWLKDKYGV